MEDYHNLKLYGYHEDDEYFLPFDSDEFNELHKKVEFIQPAVRNIIEQLKTSPDQFPRNFMKLAEYPVGRVPNEELIVNLLLNTSEKEVENYIRNTVMYENNPFNTDIDENYVMCFRRAIPSEEPLYDNFWTTPESQESFIGLRNEQPIDSPRRLHSVIKVATLAELKKHGIVDSERLGSEGEIAIDPNKKFNGVLFQFKDSHELYRLIDYIDKGGITREEILEEAKKDYYERTRLQGLPIFEKSSLEEQLGEICDETTASGFATMSNSIRNIYKENELGNEQLEEGGIDFDENDWL